MHSTRYRMRLRTPLLVIAFFALAFGAVRTLRDSWGKGPIVTVRVFPTTASRRLPPRDGKLPAIALTKDGRGFTLLPNGQTFTPWGLNYGHAGRLIEDIWETDWPAVEADWRAMKGMGANVVRVHLQVGKFMEGPDRPNAKALERLGKLVELSEKTGIYLDLTGLACYREADIPRWYDALDEAGRWAVQTKFWEAVAERCAKSPAIFCYDLMNEPISPADKRKPGDWYSGPLGEYRFIQWISLDPAGKPRTEVAKRWIKTLTAAIRKHDRTHLITVGMLPSTPAWGHFSGFVPKEVAPEVDFISVHIYPEKGKVDEALKTLEGFAVGKPVVIEETFPLACSDKELEDFIRRSRSKAVGWMGHFDGLAIERLEELSDAKKITIPQAIYLSWLRLFRKLGPELTAAPR